MRFVPAGLVLSFALGSLSVPVWAGSSSIWWPGWNISSTEDLSEINNGEKPFSHPLSALFDANPRTTWVMNSQATLEEMYEDNAEKFFANTKRGLMISGQARSLSGLQIMNGDNSSRRAFTIGNRIRTLQVTLLNGKQRHSYRLPIKDQMGWQRVSWPRQRADKVAVEFAQMVDSRKPVCASGLGLLNGADEIKWNMPQAVLFWDGLEGEGAALLLNRRGQVLESVDSYDGDKEEWSKDGRFVLALNAEQTYIWVADTKRGRIVRKIPLRFPKEGLETQWLSNDRLQVEFFRLVKGGDSKLFQTKIYRF